MGLDRRTDCRVWWLCRVLDWIGSLDSDMMEFVVTRTSGGDFTKPPCDRAIVKTMDFIDRRQRRFPLSKSVWVIEVSSLEDLLALAKAEGKLIIATGEYGFPEGVASIEIYDRYRE